MAVMKLVAAIVFLGINTVISAVPMVVLGSMLSPALKSCKIQCFQSLKAQKSCKFLM